MADSAHDCEALDPTLSISLEASAGSGKTWQLVSRVLRLLLEGAEPGGILALTFTRKAAVEMRLRLNERLRKLATESDEALDRSLRHIGLAPTPELAARARGLYRALLFAAFPPRAMTLHSFCQELLGRFALEAGVPPGFGLYDNEAELVERTWRRLQARLTSEPDGAAARALGALVDLGYTENTLRDLVETFLQRRGDWFAYTEDEADPAAFATGRLREQLGDCDAAAALRLIDGDAFTGHLRMLYRWLGEWGDVGWVKAENLEPALTARGEERLEVLEGALLTQEGKERKFEPAKKFTPAQRASLLEQHTHVVQGLLAARGQWMRAQVLARSGAAFTLCVAALAALDEELARSHALGFTELEWQTCRLLRRDGAAEWIRYRLDRGIDHLLIDEFQDTSPTQWRMLLPLLEEMAAGDSGRARSLFIVGDAKQSIYGFRRADPRLLPRATQWMREQLGAHSLPLHHSRRSAPAIIDFVNALFTLDALHGRLDFARHDTHRQEDWGRVEVAPLIAKAAKGAQANAAFRDPLAAPRLEDEDVRAHDEARQVSQRLRALVASGVEVTTQHGSHRIGWGDVMVLARARTHLHALERQFTEDGIPFVGAARGTLLQTSVARDLTALLRLLDAPHRNLELAQVLRSPLFGASDAQLVRIAQAAGRETWLSALGGIDDPLLARAHALIVQWRALASKLPAHDLLDRIARDTDAAARYEGALPKVTGDRARANLGAFLQLALEADSGRYPSLPRFLEWLEAQERAAKDAPDEPPPAAATEQVRIMTVHAAKGLEAPAVFLINAGGGQNPRTPRWLVEWPEEAERPTHFLVAPPAERLDALSRALADAHKARETREELHILYVAATRARHFLHVSGFESRANGSWHEHALAAMETLERAPLLPGGAPGTLCYAVGAPPVSAVAPDLPARRAADPRLRRPLAAATASAVAPSERAEDGSAYETAEAAARGTAIHLLLQRVSEGIADDAAVQRELRARLEVEPKTEDVARWLADARTLVQAPALARFFAGAKRAWNEVPVFTDGTTAIIDRLVDDGATLWVLDYKTHARPQAGALAERYRAQVAAYVDAVQAVWPGRPVRGGLILTATKTFVPVV